MSHDSPRRDGVRSAQQQSSSASMAAAAAATRFQSSHRLSHSHGHGDTSESGAPHDQLPSCRGSHKLGFLRKGHRGRSTPSPLPPEEEEDDEWLLEGGPLNGHVTETVSVGRAPSALSRSVDTLSTTSSDHVPTAAVTPSEKRRSKGRSLAKKTSRLFHRSNGSSHSHDDPSASSSSMLPVPQAGRQSSFSSTGSTETGSSRKWGLARVGSRGSPPQRASPDSQPSSWHPPPTFSLRRTSSSSHEASGLPVPSLRHRESASRLSTSVPALARHSAPPAHAAAQAHARQETLPGRMTSWFSNLLPTGQDSPSSQPDTTAPPSPLRKGPSVAANFFSGVRNKAVGGMRYLLDSDAQPDHCQETMWVMGVAHPGWTPNDDYGSENSSPMVKGEVSSPWSSRLREGSGNQPSPPKGLSNLFASSFNLAAQAEPLTPPADANKVRKDKPKEKEALRWPEQFHDDFRSRVWCTYRSQYAPILSLPRETLLPNPTAYYGAFSQGFSSDLPTPNPLNSSQSGRPWGWPKGDERGLTSDAGWGCMLRTGQSMLANALLHVHLGRGWRVAASKPSLSPQSPLDLAELEAYATYVRILSWFMDDPSPLCPFSVHRMALIGKELGKEVGEWFGPSTAAGALKTLANSFPLCGLSVATAVDGIIYRSDVYAASNTPSDSWHSNEAPRRQPESVHKSTWGDKAVLILIGIRLGLDGVNPIYYDSIKTLFTYPQSVGIAGGRPSSSYYFVASQASSLFYLDPHFTRPAVPLRVPPYEASGLGSRLSTASSSPAPPVHHESPDQAADGSSEDSHASSASTSLENGDLPDSPLKNKSRRGTVTQPLQVDPHHSRPESPTSPSTPTVHNTRGSEEATTPSPAHPHHLHHSSDSSAPVHYPVDPLTAWYASAYSDDHLRTFHCDRVKKLPLSGLDPSMLLGFLCTSEAEFDDLCERIAKLPQKIFAVQDELPTWSDDEDGALESVSEQMSGPEFDDDDEEGVHGVSDVLAGDEVDEFGRLSRPPLATMSSSATAIHLPTAGLTRASLTHTKLAAVARESASAESTPDATPDTTLDDMSLVEAPGSDEEPPEVLQDEPAPTPATSTPTLFPADLHPVATEDIETVRAHAPMASVTALSRQSSASSRRSSGSRVVARAPSISASQPGTPAKPSSANVSAHGHTPPHSRSSSLSHGGTSQPVTTLRKASTERVPSSSPSPKHTRAASHPSPPVTAQPTGHGRHQSVSSVRRRPPPINLAKEPIHPPPRSASLSAPTSASAAAPSPGLAAQVTLPDEDADDLEVIDSPADSKCASALPTEERTETPVLVERPPAEHP